MALFMTSMSHSLAGSMTTTSVKVTQGEGPGGPVAIAMFDNVADTDDELSFSRGDLLMVICVDYEGMEGWWMCASMNGQRSGLVPANRVRLASNQVSIQHCC